MIMSHHNKNENEPQGDAPYLAGDTTPHRTISSLEERADGLGPSWSLLQLLDMLVYPKAESLPMVCLTRTNQQRQEPRALADLWKSLGHPVSEFSREPRVLYKRIEDSYAQTPNYDCASSGNIMKVPTP